MRLGEAVVAEGRMSTSDADAEAKSHLDLSVENERLTQEEADAKLADVSERITDFVNNGFPHHG